MTPAFTDEFAALDAVEQARLVQTGQVTVLELVDAAIARIQEANPLLNAVVTELFDQARRSKPSGPLAGVPYLLKDTKDLAGCRRTSGSRLMEHNVSTETAPMARAAVAAGLVILGKTNTSEFGFLPTTESMLFGPTRNPWNLTVSSGGSSGGSAAAVAAGMVPMAHGSDGGGSIRIPASCCGIVGLKPSRGRMRLEKSEAWEVTGEHCFSRSVRDSALLLSLTEDLSEGAPFSPVGYVQSPTFRRRRIAFTVADAGGRTPDAEVGFAVHGTALLLEQLGHEVVPVEDPLEIEPATDAFQTLWSYNAAAIRNQAVKCGLDPEQLLEPYTLQLAIRFDGYTPDRLPRALATLADIERTFDDFLSKYDAWLAPVTNMPPPLLGELAPASAFAELDEKLSRYVAYTAGHNVAGTPAVSLPLGLSTSRLPIGSQLSAAKGQEHVLFELAYELEAAAPWRDKWPPIRAGQVAAARDR